MSCFQNDGFSKKRSSFQILNWWKCTKEVQIWPKNSSRGRLLMNFEFREIPGIRCQKILSSRVWIVECWEVWELLECESWVWIVERCESLGESGAGCKQSWDITGDNSEREDLGPGCNKVYVAPCLVKLGVTPQHLAVSARCKWGRRVKLIQDNVLWQQN